MDRKSPMFGRTKDADTGKARGPHVCRPSLGSLTLSTPGRWTDAVERALAPPPGVGQMDTVQVDLRGFPKHSSGGPHSTPDPKILEIPIQPWLVKGHRWAQPRSLITLFSSVCPIPLKTKDTDNSERYYVTFLYVQGTVRKSKSILGHKGSLNINCTGLNV